jgi:RimK-like ATP-grasp domain
MLTFKIADGCGPTGQRLRQLVGPGPASSMGVVCWGRGHNGTEPSLNALASSSNKLQQLQKFKAGGLLTPPFWEQLPTAAENFPVLGRKLQHHGGLDIKLFMQPQDQQDFGHFDFYTRFVPRATEYRSWVYRRRHLATYEKLRKPGFRRRSTVNANYRNGFAFTLMASESVPEGLREIAAKAVDLLGLDFGAVDVLRGMDGKLYVLEVNTAPGIQGEDRAGFQALGRKIRRWAELGCPKRNGALNGA